MAKRKPKKKVKPEQLLGKGIARMGAQSLQNVKQRNCLAMGGKWKNGKCVY